MPPNWCFIPLRSRSVMVQNGVVFKYHEVNPLGNKGLSKTKYLPPMRLCFQEGLITNKEQ